MNLRLFISIQIILICFLAKAQYQIKSENTEYLFWTPTVELDYSHFQSESKEECENYRDKYSINMAANIQLLGVVDIPKSHLSRRIKKRKGKDKLYLAPVFCKKCSCILSENKLELETNQLLFDVAEMCSRGARKELLQWEKETDVNNVNTTHFLTVKNKWDKEMRDIWATIIKEVLVEKEDGALLKWKKLVKKLLDENVEYATQQVDIKRLMIGEPIVKGYVQAETILSDFKK